MIRSPTGDKEENPRFLAEQLITYIGNKRNLLAFIGNGISLVQKRLGKAKLDSFDAFSGSGVVSRYLKRFSRTLYSNDLEKYASVINECYLTNAEDFDDAAFRSVYEGITRRLEREPLMPGLVAALYAPADDLEIKEGERVFFTTRNAKYVDTARKAIDDVPENLKKYLLAPLLSEVSIHANTSGVFKGFYKNADTGTGQFGGKNRDALSRIMSDIKIPYPLFGDYSCDCRVLNGDTNVVCEHMDEVDIAYLDPPYNQHPYGSNYFMLNVVLEYRRPSALSDVSGIPEGWNRSAYNRRHKACDALESLVSRLKAKFLLVSFNSEGFIPLDRMKELLEAHGKLTILETKYNAFRGSRNLSGRQMHVKEYLYLLEKS